MSCHNLVLRCITFLPLRGVSTTSRVQRHVYPPRLAFAFCAYKSQWRQRGKFQLVSVYHTRITYATRFHRGDSSPTKRQGYRTAFSRLPVFIYSSIDSCRADQFLNRSNLFPLKLKRTGPEVHAKFAGTWGQPTNHLSHLVKPDHSIYLMILSF